MSFSPRSSRTSFHSNASSPYSTSRCSVSDSDLIERERRLCEEEKNYLIELRKFHEDVAEYEHKKKDLDNETGNITDRARILATIQQQVSEYEEALEERYKAAQQSIQQSEENSELDENICERLEKELEEVTNKIPKLKDNGSEVDTIVSEYKKVSAENEAKTRLIMKRRGILQDKLMKLNHETEKLKDEEEQEKGINKGARELLDTMKSRQIDQEERKKRAQLIEEMNQEIQAYNEQIKEADDQENAFTEEQQKHAETLTKLQKDLEETQAENNNLRELQGRLEQSEKQCITLESQIIEIDGEIARLKRKIQIQNSEKTRLDKIEKSIEEREESNKKKAEECDKFEEELNERQKKMEVAQEKFPEMKKEIDALKNNYEDKEREIELYKTQIKTIFEQCQKLQEEINEIYSGREEENFNAIDDLKKILGAA